MYNKDSENGIGDRMIQNLLEKEPKEAFVLACGEKKTAYYHERAKISLDLHKKFYYNSAMIAFYEAGELAGLIREIMDSCEAISGGNSSSTLVSKRYLSDSRIIFSPVKR